MGAGLLSISQTGTADKTVLSRLFNESLEATRPQPKVATEEEGKRGTKLTNEQKRGTTFLRSSKQL